MLILNTFKAMHKKIIGAFLMHSLVGSFSWANSLRNVEPTPLRIGISQDFTTLDQRLFAATASFYVGGFLLRNWVALDDQLRWIPMLAKDIPSVSAGTLKKNSDGSMTATWEFRESAKWGDGKPIDCADVEFSRYTGMHPRFPVASRDVFEQVLKIAWAKETPRKCQITYKTQRYDFFRVTPFPVPAHLEKDLFEASLKDGKDPIANSLYTTNPTNPGLYSGPFVVQKVEFGHFIQLKKNEFFYGKESQVGAITIRVLPSNQALLDLLLTDEINLSGTPGLTADLADGVNKKTNFKVYTVPTADVEVVEINVDDPLLRDLNLRRALADSIPFDLLSRVINTKAARELRRAFVPFWPVDGSTQDLATAMGPSAKRLKEIKKSIRHLKKPIRLTLQTTAEQKERSLVGQLLQSQWKNIGVEISIFTKPARVLIGEILRQRKFQLALVRRTSYPGFLPNQFSQGAVPNSENSWTGVNFSGWNNKLAHQVREKFELEMNANQRSSLIHEFGDIYKKDQPGIPLYYAPRYVVAPANLQGFNPSTNFFFESLFAENWAFGAASNEDKSGLGTPN